MSQSEWGGEFDPMADPEEQRHILSGETNSFAATRSYRRLAHFNGTHARRQAFYSLPSSHWQLLSKPPFSVLDSLIKLDDLIDENAKLAEAIFLKGFQALIAPTLDSEWVASKVEAKHAHNEYQVYSSIMDHLDVKTSQNDMDKARSCLNQFHREWSIGGIAERQKCFDPVIEALDAEYAMRYEPSAEGNRSSIKILVPGAGLGRLVFDICHAGYTVEGNEISYHELIASSLVLNHVEHADQFTIAPFALNGSNLLSRADQFQTFTIPDIHPKSELEQTGRGHRSPAQERMSMSSGDFCVLYSTPDAENSFDAVATVFFIDTAPNLIRYIEAVHNCLRPGGLWINLGPLLWHHASSSRNSDGPQFPKEHQAHGDAGIGDPGSVELTDEEVMLLVQGFGFEIERHEPGSVETGYMTNPKSMLQSTYRASFWIARRN